METKRSDNLCNFYILPLLGLNKTSFGGSGNFVNSYLSKDTNYIVIVLKGATPSFEEHQYYVTDFLNITGQVVLVFNVPIEFKPTIVKFIEGKYSQFSPPAKQLIKQKSGLNYKAPIGGGKVSTARELLALDRDPDLKKVWEQELGVKLAADAELMDIPDERNFYDFKVQQVQQDSH